MNSRTRIKFCGLVRLEDVQFASRLGVDALGLVFYPKSPRYLSLDEALVLRRAMSSFVSCVGLFVNADPALVKSWQSRLGLDVLQFHGDETPEVIAQSLGAAALPLSKGFVKPESLPPFWRALRVRPDSDLLESSRDFQDADAFLLDAFSEAYGGTGKKFDWALAKSLPPSRVILSGGLDAASVGEGIAALRPMAVDVSSGIQGDHAREKNPARMEQFVAAVRSADFLKASNEAI